MPSRPNFRPPNASPPLVRTRRGRRTLEFAPGDIQSEMRLDRPHALVLDYARAMMCFFLFVPYPRHIVMVGLGGGSMAKFCLRRFPDARITVIELRADVIALRGQFLVPPDDERFRVVHADARSYIASMPPGVADVIVVDGFDEDGLPAALSDEAFYRACRRVLAPDGVLAANVFSYDPRIETVLTTLSQVFDARLCRFDKVAGNNHIVFALATGSPDSPASSMLRRVGPRPAFGPALLQRLLVRLALAWLAARSVFA